MSFTGIRKKPKKAVFHVDEKELLCKNGCGFYGNVAWQGLCSKCWREVSQKQREAQIKSDEKYAREIHEKEEKALAAGRPPHPVQSEEKSGAEDVNQQMGIGFERFEGRQQHRSKATSRTQTMKTILSRSVGRPSKAETADSLPESHSHHKVKRQLSSESRNANNRFVEYLRRLNKNMAEDLYKLCTELVNKFEQSKDRLSIDEAAGKVQDFYAELGERINSHQIYHGVTVNQQTSIMDHVEKYLMTRLYRDFFSPSDTDDEQRDLAIQNRIRKLRWVTGDMLGAAIEEGNMSVSQLIVKAQTELIEINAKKAPIEKLGCVVRCSKIIFQIFKTSQGTPATADDYLPILIYLILKANPPQLHSNIQFISRFSSPSRIQSGEVGYFFTNLTCAIMFVENLDAQSLSLTQEEYNDYMSGKLQPTQSSEPICEGLYTMYNNITALEDLRERQERLMKNAREFSQEMEAWKQRVTSQVEEAISSKTLVRKRYSKQPVNIDHDVGDEVKGLPLPMEPQKVN